MVVTDFGDVTSATIVDELSETDIGVDIGPKSLQAIQSIISKSKTIFWNGPVGVFETPEYSNGTFEIAKAMAAASESTTIVGGGDSIAALNNAGYFDDIDDVSTGGGASLEFLEGKELPGIKV